MPFSKREAALRLTAVTALVLILGALAGAFTGFIMTVIGDVVSEGEIIGSASRVYAIGALMGAIFGAAVGTPIAMLMLRRVPLWRATVETAAAAGTGVVLGQVIPIPFGFAVGAVALALVAAWRLRRAYAPRPESPPPRDPARSP